MTGFQKRGLHIGHRVEIPAYCDLWMQGARFGTIHSVKDCGDKILAKIRMDHPQVTRLQVVNLLDCAKLRTLEGDLQHVNF